VRTLVISDLHLGTRAGHDVLQLPAARDRLFAALAGVDRLVLLGDALELLTRTPRRAAARAEPVIRALGRALGPDREVIVVPGNHDAGLVRRWALAQGPRLAPSTAVDPSAKIGDGVRLSPGVVIGPNVEIGERTILGPNVVIGRGVAIGRDCEVGSNVSITHAYIGDGVVILPGAQIGQPGFGFASGASGHVKIPQIGRVLVQDRVEIGACATIDRGAIGDTVIGEGTKIDNLVQIGHNTHIGRHCVIVSQVGISGSCSIGDFVVIGGQAGIADHVTIGDGARLAARTGVFPGELKGGQDYGGVPARPVKEWLRDMVVLTKLSKAKKRDNNG